MLKTVIFLTIPVFESKDYFDAKTGIKAQNSSKVRPAPILTVVIA